MKINLTKLEIGAIVSAAENMRDNMYDYFNFMPKKKLEKFVAAYETGLEKLKKAMDNQQRKLPNI